MYVCALLQRTTVRKCANSEIKKRRAVMIPNEGPAERGRVDVFTFHLCLVVVFM